MTGSVRIALVGCGTVAMGQHIPGFRGLARGEADLTVFCSRSEAAGRAAADAWGGGDVLADWREAVQRDDVDAVDICLPNGLHAEVALTAIRAGKHVLVEKPVATSLADADAMVSAADEHGTVLMTAQNGRYASGMAAAAKAVRDGLIGDVTAVEAWLAHGGPRRWAPAAEWFYDRAVSGGGALIDLGIHAIDNVRFVTGQEVAEVAAMTGDVRGSVEFDGHLLFRLGNGALGSLKGSWNAPFGNDRAMTVWGTQGQLVVWPDRAMVRTPGGVGMPVAAAPERDLYADFVQACRGLPAKGPSGRDGRAGLAVVLAGYRSASERVFVRPG